MTDNILKILEVHSTLKLQIELVPQTCWLSNLRSNLTKSQWDKLRYSAYAKAGNKCEICGGVGRQHPVECHEVWEYDDKTRVQRLASIQAICPLCHGVKHLGLTRIRGFHADAQAQFMKVNNTTKEFFDCIEEAVFEQWTERSKYHDWTLDLSLLKEYGLEVTPQQPTPHETEDTKWYSSK